MKSKKYVFAGNRAFVLQRMLELDLDISRIWAVRGSYLEKYLDKEGFEYSTIEEKGHFFEEIEESEFDIFVSNGLPIILPERILCREKGQFVNIHPSLLPDLRGKSPVSGAILYRRDSGVTCHIMSAGIDSGDIISQIKIPFSDDLDAGLLYQICFRAEADVFEAAYERNFLPISKQTLCDTDIYYSYKPDDLEIDLGRDTTEIITSKVKAFSTGNKGARLRIGDKTFICCNAKALYNSYVIDRFRETARGEILLQYDDKIVVKNVFNELLVITVKIEEQRNIVK